MDQVFDMVSDAYSETTKALALESEIEYLTEILVLKYCVSFSFIISHATF